MDTVFNFVLISSIYGSVVGIIIILMKSLLKEKISGKWNFLIWSVLLLKLLIPFGPQSNISLFNNVPINMEQIQTTYENSNKTLSLPQAAQKIKKDDNLNKESKNSNNNSLSSIDKINKTGVETYILRYIPYIWAFGALVFFGWIVLTNCILQRELKIKGSNLNEYDEYIKKIFEKCREKMGIEKNIIVMFQNIINTPSLFGLIQPKILLPTTILNLSEKEIEYIILHELAHYKRKDILVNYILLIFQIIHWFNPIIWYCFKQISQDMEIATDERVLEILEVEEHKNYGKALLSMLENYNSTKMTPKLIGLIDGKKSIERRIKRIKVAKFFRGNGKKGILLGILCISVLSTVLLTNGKYSDTKKQNMSGNKLVTEQYDAENLYKFKSPYIGDASNVSNLLNTLPLNSYKGKIQLATESKPYGLSVDYNMTDYKSTGMNTEAKEGTIEKTLLSNSSILFSLIDNLDIISYNIEGGNKTNEYTFSRDDVQFYFSKNLGEYSKEKDQFKELIILLNDANWAENLYNNESALENIFLNSKNEVKNESTLIDLKETK